MLPTGWWQVAAVSVVKIGVASDTTTAVALATGVAQCVSLQHALAGLAIHSGGRRSAARRADSMRPAPEPC